MSSCPNNCNNHGRCDFSQCVCEPPWYGADCSLRKCPGTVCYADSSTKEQFCLECSSRGRCIENACVCDPGWSYEDCSVPVCENNCSSTPFEQRGVCVE
ncbi:Tenascin (TN) (Cytotactin) (GMEM) (GP 150-225) (Glioma-associated-extracellular matrix antigen) (Hexabrachion) (JI) (Myotendinous antigen) (Neuronectin) (Tenascin-C) (TN-C), partial [Durusdinium trenchii]